MDAEAGGGGGLTGDPPPKLQENDQGGAMKKDGDELPGEDDEAEGDMKREAEVLVEATFGDEDNEPAAKAAKLAEARDEKHLAALTAEQVAAEGNGGAEGSGGATGAEGQAAALSAAG